MVNTKFGRSGFTIPVPKPGDGTKILLNHDGTMTCSWDNRMALDAAIGGPPGSPDYADYNAADDNGDPDDSNDLVDKIYQLLAGKLEPADLEALIKLIQPDDDEPMPAQAQDRRLALDALIHRRLAQGAQVRARRAQAVTTGLERRFPDLKGARVVG
jgi:hypothetical protein